MPDFLAHLLPWVDEIIIIDDDSNDRSSEIAYAAGPKIRFIVAPRKQGEGFCDQRNKGITAARSDWLLHMDIDERVPPALAEEVLHAIRDNSREAYRYRRLNFFLHRPIRSGGWQNWNQVHLARREGSRFVGKVHETFVLASGVERIGQLRSYMWHLNDSNFAERLRKNMLYSQMEADKILGRGLEVKWFHFLLHPFYRVLKSYIFHGGYKEGTLGVLYAMYVLSSTFNWYATAWDRANAISRQTLEAELRSLWQQRQHKAATTTSSNAR
jgi:(heptosyl)LPS beta-1,4-glucosyltransferase